MAQELRRCGSNIKNEKTTCDGNGGTNPAMPMGECAKSKRCKRDERKHDKRGTWRRLPIQHKNSKQVEHEQFPKIEHGCEGDKRRKCEIKIPTDTGEERLQKDREEQNGKCGEKF